MEFFKAQFMMHCKREFPSNDLLNMWILPQLSYGGFLKWGIPNSWMVDFMENLMNMEDLRVPRF
jgi:hypothetical protein